MEAEPLFDTTLTPTEVSLVAKRAIERALPGEVWVRGEIRNKKRNPRDGHVYFDITDRDTTLRVTLWNSERLLVNHQLAKAGNAVRIDDGTEVRIRCEPKFWTQRGALSLRMLGIDPAFTLGRLAEQRELLIAALRAESLLRAQATLPVAGLPLRVGIVTALESAAHADVLETFASSGIGFRLIECDARVQGVDADQSIVAALHRVADAGVDVLCLVRGGGSRSDLAAFDRELVARAIAGLGVPVFTGIGHETDTSVADEVANQRHRTPTACAAAVVERARAWCTQRDEVWAAVLRSATTGCDRAGARLAVVGRNAATAGRHHIRSASDRLEADRTRLRRAPVAAVDRAGRTMSGHTARLAGLDPAALLARGWSITTTADGRLVRSPADAVAGTELRTTTAGGTLRSRVEENV